MMTKFSDSIRASIGLSSNRLGSTLAQAGAEFRVFRRFQAVLHQGEL
jgi:hypothetical protein